MKTYQRMLAAVALVLALALLPLALVSEDSDAYKLDSVEIVRGFTDTGEGAIAVYVLNGTDSAVTVKVSIDAANGSRNYSTKDFTIPANTTQQNVKDSDRHVEMTFSFEGSGHKEIRITVTGAGDTQSIIKDIDVAHSIWSDWTTYVVIIIVIVFVVVIVWLRLRSVSDAKKNEGPKEKVFTKMEEERKAKKAATKQPAAPAEPARKKTYEGSKRKKQ